VTRSAKIEMSWVGIGQTVFDGRLVIYSTRGQQAAIYRFPELLKITELATNQFVDHKTQDMIDKRISRARMSDNCFYERLAPRIPLWDGKNHLILDLGSRLRCQRCKKPPIFLRNQPILMDSGELKFSATFFNDSGRVKIPPKTRRFA